MRDVVVLDAGPLSMVAHPRDNIEAKDWLETLLRSGEFLIFIPEIADYEVRRELLRAKKSKSVQRLDALKDALSYLPLTTDAMLLAAELWARVRQQGRPTASDKALDADVILAAQALSLSDGAIVATDNVGHLDRFVTARRWPDIKPAE